MDPGTVPPLMQIQARRFGEVLADGINLLAKTWRPLIAPSFGAFMVLGAATLIVFRLTGASELLDLIFNNPSARELLPTEELAAVTARFLTALLWSVMFQVAASTFVTLAAHRVVAAQIAGKPITSAEAARFAAAKMARGVLAVAGAFVAIFASLLLLVLPGIWVAFSLSMVLPIVVFEDAGPSQALRRSFQLVKGRWWPTAGFLLLVGLLGSAAAQIVQFVVLPLVTVGEFSIGLGLSFVVAVVFQGFIAAAIAVMATAWYLDLKTREDLSATSNLG